MFYYFTSSLFALLFTLFRRWQVLGKDKVPARGPMIVVANHNSYWDPIIVGAVMPRRVTFMAKAELFRLWPLGPIIAGLGAFPVRRGRGDRQALRRSLEVLSKGGVVGMFPEGGRNRTGQSLAPLQKGASFLAAKTGAILLPVALIGVREALGGISWRPLKVIVGDPILPEVGEDVASLNSRLENVLRDLFTGDG